MSGEHHKQTGPVRTRLTAALFGAFHALPSRILKAPDAAWAKPGLPKPCPHRSHLLKKWEIALISAAAVTLLWGLALGRMPCLAWWGAIYPELAPADGSVQTVSAMDGEIVVLRLRLLEWLEACLRALGIE